MAPLAYMRGRTLDDAFIILDEAQNTTPEQMKMFLTRLGENSKMVITGDLTQIDLPEKRKAVFSMQPKFYEIFTIFPFWNSRKRTLCDINWFKILFGLMKKPIH